jgi:hypothetical protein
MMHLTWPQVEQTIHQLIGYAISEEWEPPTVPGEAWPVDRYEVVSDTAGLVGPRPGELAPGDAVAVVIDRYISRIRKGEGTRPSRKAFISDLEFEVELNEAPPESGLVAALKWARSATNNRFDMVYEDREALLMETCPAHGHFDPDTPCPECLRQAAEFFAGDADTNCGGRC